MRKNILKKKTENHGDIFIIFCGYDLIFHLFIYLFVQNEYVK
jgi:hypothetical protein